MIWPVWDLPFGHTKRGGDERHQSSPPYNQHGIRFLFDLLNELNEPGYVVFATTYSDGELKRVSQGNDGFDATPRMFGRLHDDGFWYQVRWLVDTGNLNVFGRERLEEFHVA